MSFSVLLSLSKHEIFEGILYLFSNLLRRKVILTMMLRLFTGAVVFVALSSIAAAQSSMEKLRLAYSAIGGSQASVWIP